MNPAAILALADGLIMVNALAFADALDDRRFLVQAVLRDQQRDMLADRFSGR